MIEIYLIFNFSLLLLRVTSCGNLFFLIPLSHNFCFNLLWWYRFRLKTNRCKTTVKHIKQGRPTRGPRKGFGWSAQYFLKPCVPLILAEVEDRFYVKTPVFLFFFSSFRDHYDFGAKSGVFCLLGPPIFLKSQNGPRLKKVGHPWYKASK